MQGLGMLQGVSQYNIYDRNIAYLKKYNNDNYKIVYMKSCRKAGYVERSSSIKGKKNTAGNTYKLDESLSRTRAKVYELALCNPWEYFVTLTLSPDGHNRKDLAAYKRQLSKWLNNLNYRHNINIKYLLIPEPHKNGAWHMHGLFSGIPEEWLTEFTLQERLPHRVRRLLRKGRTIYNWTGYADKFGWVTCERIRNFDACAKYITKYITKELGNSGIELNHHMYYCSKGLKRAETVIKGHLTQEFEPDFYNDYVAIKSFDSLDDAILHFVDDNVNREALTFNSLIENIQRRCGEWIPCPQP